MGYDITLHPFSRKEFKYFIEDVIEKPEIIDARVTAIHNNEVERSFIVDAIYSRIPDFKLNVEQKSNDVRKTIGILSAAILGYLHPYWYLRNGLLTELLNHKLFSNLSTNFSFLVKEENKLYFDSEDGIIENFSSGFYIPFQQIKKLNDELIQPSSYKIAKKILGSENCLNLKKCLTYCIDNELDLLEATDIYVPFAGENSSFHPNARALHLKNTSDFTNHSKKKIPTNFKKLVEKHEINKSWWENLNGSWQESIKIGYRDMVTPTFTDMAARNTHVERKFDKKSLDLSKLRELQSIHLQLVDRENQTSTLAPLFNFPKIKELSLRSFRKPRIDFDSKRLLQFPKLEDLEIANICLQNFENLKDLKNLNYLSLEETGIDKTQLKKVFLFPKLTSMYLSSFRSVSFLQGNSQIEALTLSYTKGLKKLPNLKRLYLFLKEANPVFQECPNIEYIDCCYSKRMTNLSSFIGMTKLKTLFLRAPMKSIDLNLLSEIKSIENFFVGSRTKLDTIPEPIGNIKFIYLNSEIDQKIKEKINNKFPNASIKKFKHHYYK